ncbi:hypothetical protein B9Z55_021385 [Caenorhabditis nigoni]|nr:hypothetical protein B9Z55_021385 [Caenorhabditis nigoni]
MLKPHTAVVERYNKEAVEAFIGFITSVFCDQKRSTQCVDYFIAMGMESFDGLHSILDGWKDLGLLEFDTVKQMKTELYHAAQYLRTDYRLHVKKTSRVADHCAVYALSDPDDLALAESCSNGPDAHAHDVKCDRCERTKAILDVIEEHAKEFLDEKEKDVAHPDADDADNYHISHVTACVEKDYFAQHSFVHIYDGSVTQDSRLVVVTIAHFLKELKNVGINKVFLRSDNAGAYHSALTIGSLYWLEEETEMAIGAYTFSESQNGKSSSDRDANRVKRRVMEYVNKGK